MSFDTGAFFRGKTPAEQAALRTNTRRNEFALYNERANAPLQSGFMQLRNQAAQQELEAGQQGRARAAEAELVKMVQSSPDPAAAYPQALQRAQAMGIDTSQLPEEYDPQFMQGLEAVYAAPPEKLTEFERKLAMTPEHLREQALMIDMGIIPDANATLRGEMGDRVKPTSAMVEYGFARDQGFDGSFEDWKQSQGRSNSTSAMKEYEFAKSQGFDGSFEDWKQSQRGNGVTVGLDENGNPLVQVGGNPVGRQTKNEINQRELDQRDILSGLQIIEDDIIGNPEVLDTLTLGGDLEAAKVSWADYLGMADRLSPEELARVDNATEFRADVADQFNRYVKSITGAAMTIQEAERIQQAFPTTKDGPQRFMSKLRGVVKRTRVAIARYNYWRNQGLGAADAEGLAEKTSLGEMERLMRDRRNELMEKIQNGEISDTEASIKFQQEFGV